MFPSDTDLDTKVTLETERMPIPEDPPFHILLLGDWSGKESHSDNSDLSKIRPMEIDRDNFDEIIKKLDVKLSLDFQGNKENLLSIHFNELEDFHPDKIFQQLPLFAELRDVRRRLVNSDTFESAAREVRSWFTETESEESVDVKQKISSTKTINSSPDDLLDQILGQADENVPAAQSQNAESSELGAFVKNIVKPYLVQIDAAEQSKLLMVVDEVISDLMRKILHHPQFQALESSWRGAYLLVRRVETDTDLKIFLLDISKNELADNLKSINDLTDSRIYKIFASQNEPWAVICGNYAFSLNVEDVAALIRIAKIANNTNTPFISHINPEMFGFNSFGEVENSDSWKVSEDSTEGKLWITLRSVPEVAHLGLALPRILARLPYGEKTEPTETFYFEEFITSISHEQYLWSNPIFIGAMLLAQTFRKYSWDISSNFLKDVDNLPVHLYQENGETKTKPCAEIAFTENNCEKILEQGLIPLISFRDSDRVRVGRFQAVANIFLKGRWD